MNHAGMINELQTRVRRLEKALETALTDLADLRVKVGWTAFKTMHLVDDATPNHPWSCACEICKRER